MGFLKSTAGKIILGLAVLFMLFLALLGGAWVWFMRSPRYALWKMSGAAESGNYEEFSKYIDMESILENAMDDALAEETAEMDDETRQLTEAYLDTMMPGLVEEAESSMKESIEDGDYNEDVFSFTLINVFTEADVSMDGDIANVTVLDEDGNEQSFKMQKSDGTWQIYELDLESLGADAAM